MHRISRGCISSRRARIHGGHVTIFAALHAVRFPARDRATRRSAIFAFIYPSRGESRVRMSADNVEFSGVDHSVVRIGSDSRD